MTLKPPICDPSPSEPGYNRRAQVTPGWTFLVLGTGVRAAAWRILSPLAPNPQADIRRREHLGRFYRKAVRDRLALQGGTGDFP